MPENTCSQYGIQDGVSSLLGRQELHGAVLAADEGPMVRPASTSFPWQGTAEWSRQAKQLGWSHSVSFPPQPGTVNSGLGWSGASPLHFSWRDASGFRQSATEFASRQPKDRCCSFSEPRKGSFLIGQTPSQRSKYHAT